MYRTKIKELIKWKLSNKRKPLIFLGVTQQTNAITNKHNLT